MNIISINKTGKMHINDSKGCDDAIYISAHGDVICVADGVSNSEFGGIGANALVKKIGQYFSAEENKKMLENNDVADIRLNICTIIEHIIHSLCRKYKTQNCDAFSSTFLALIKTSKNNITVLHAGDGCIIGQPKTLQENSISIISYPDNSPSGKVYSAGHIEQKNRMRVFHLNSNDYNSILLCTDGFSDPYLEPSSQAFDMQEFSNVFRINSKIELERLVSNYHIGSFNVTDDISCVIYRNENHTPPAMADEPPYTYEDFVIEPSHVMNKEDIEYTINNTSNSERKSASEVQRQNIPIEKRKSEKSKNKTSPKGLGFLVGMLTLLLVFSTLCFFYSQINSLRDTVQYNQNKLEEISNEYTSLKNQFNAMALENYNNENNNEIVSEEESLNQHTSEAITDTSVNQIE